MSDPQETERSSGDGDAVDRKGAAAAVPGKPAEGTHGGGSEASTGAASTPKTEADTAKPAPATDAAKPESPAATDAAKPSAGAAEPESKPAAAETKPAVAETKPAVAETKPAAAETKPAVAETKPAAAETKPAAAASKPMSEVGASSGAAKPAGAAGRGRERVMTVVAGVAVLALLVTVALFVWPGVLAGPGKPDDAAAAVTGALSSKDAAQVEQLSCHDQEGKATAQLPPQVLQLIQGVKQSGPPKLALDTQALVPAELTLGVPGQSQTVPVEVLLGVTSGKWCLNGIAQRQQQ